MTVTYLDGTSASVPDCYGARLIEQGKAVLAKEPVDVPKKAPKKAEKVEDVVMPDGTV